MQVGIVVNIGAMIANLKINRARSQVAKCDFIVDKLGYKILWIESCLNPEDQNEIYFSIRLRDGFGKRARVNYCINIQEKTLFIADIDNEEMINRGIGSIIMKYLDKRAVEFAMTTIYGNISSVDLDHLPRLMHFYEKNGYNFEKTAITKTVGANENKLYNSL